jgi:hypothetical protein
MPLPARATRPKPVSVLLVMPPPATTTWSSPPSTDCRKTDGVGPPICSESDCTAAGMVELMGTNFGSTSRPRLLKKPSSRATKTDAKSVTAV